MPQTTRTPPPDEVIDTLLRAAATLYESADASTHQPHSKTRTSMGLAALIESWCADYAKDHAETLLADLSPEARQIDAVVLDALRSRSLAYGASGD